MSRLVRARPEERRELAGDLGGRLAAVGQRPQLDRHRSGGLLCPERRLAGALGRLVVGERLAASRRHRGCAASARTPPSRQGGRRGASRSRRPSSGPSSRRCRAAPAGAARGRRRRGLPSRRAAASPSYSLAITAQSSCTRRAMLAGKRWSAGFSRKTSSSCSGSIAAISARVETRRAASTARAATRTPSAPSPAGRARSRSCSASGLSPRNASASGSPVKWSGCRGHGGRPSPDPGLTEP